MKKRGRNFHEGWLITIPTTFGSPWPRSEVEGPSNLNDPASRNKRNIRTRDTSRRNEGSVPFPLFLHRRGTLRPRRSVLLIDSSIAVSAGPPTWLPTNTVCRNTIEKKSILDWGYGDAGIELEIIVGGFFWGQILWNWKERGRFLRVEIGDSQFELGENWKK